MISEFKKPEFKEGLIELRVAEGEVCIYATESGLQAISKYCQELINKPKIGHIHLEDYEILTPNSLKGVIAIFDK